MKFRKKPVVIEAFQMTSDLVAQHILDKAPLPFGLRIRNHSCHPGRREIHHWYLSIDTLEGKMQVLENDWIIRGIKGEIYPCKPDIFAATYDPVEP